MGKADELEKKVERKQRKKWQQVQKSKPHKRRARYVHGYWQQRVAQPIHVGPYKRQPRRTKAEVKAKGTRIWQRKKKKDEIARRQVPG